MSVSTVEQRNGKAVVVHYGPDLEPFAWHTPLSNSTRCSLCANGEPVHSTFANGSPCIIRYILGTGWEVTPADE